MAEDLPSKTQLDKLGDRLRTGSKDESDLRALDNYRRSFRNAYDTVDSTLRALFGSEGTGRPAKTTAAIVDKLTRQQIRLSQIQDIAGIRMVVNSIGEQDRVVIALRQAFSVTYVDDRRVKPSHGYRAVHVIVEAQGKLVEVQVRTDEQHRWAEVSEKMADVIDPAIKYGGGPADVRELLSVFAERVVLWETLERHHEQMLALASKSRDLASTVDDLEQRRKLEAVAVEAELTVQRNTDEAKRNHQASFVEMMRILNEIKRRKAR